MAIVHFWEKPGCAGNARQQDLLRRAGHQLVIHDLLAHPWTAEELLAFLGDRPVADWFNQSSPRVKSREVVPEDLTPTAALRLLLEDPLLIRRPLLESGGRREVGFVLDVLAGWIGVEPEEPDVACIETHSEGAAGGGRPGAAGGPGGPHPPGSMEACGAAAGLRCPSRPG